MLYTEDFHSFILYLSMKQRDKRVNRIDLLMYTVSQKNCAKFFSAELRQIFTNFDNFWQKDGKEAKIMRGALIFHLT